MKNLFRAISYALALAGVFAFLSVASRLGAQTLVGLLGLSDQKAVATIYTAEVCTRVLLVGVVFWKLTVTLARAPDFGGLGDMFRQKGVLFALVFFAASLLALDNRLYWWGQYMANAVHPSDTTILTAYRSAFMCACTNAITTMLMDFNRPYKYGLMFVGLTAVAFAMFGAAYLYL